MKSKYQIVNSKYWGVGFLLFLFAIFFLLFSFTTHAATKLEVGIPGDPGKAAGDTVSGPVEYIKFLYLFVLSFVGIAGFVTLVIWGTVWVASGIVDQKARALEGIRSSLIGIAIAFSAYLILATINPDLTVIRLPGISQVNTQPSLVDYAGTRWVCVGTASPDGYAQTNSSRCNPATQNIVCGGRVAECYIQKQNLWACVYSGMGGGSQCPDANNATSFYNSPISDTFCRTNCTATRLIWFNDCYRRNTTVSCFSPQPSQ